MKYLFIKMFNIELFITMFLILAIIWAIILIYKKQENCLENDYTIKRLKHKLLPIFPELQYVKLMRGNTSYTINKSKIYICTESKGRLYDDNMLIYVILHELAHVLCLEIGHSAQFQIIFKSLLLRAEFYGLYNPSKPRPNDYCL